MAGALSNSTSRLIGALFGDGSATGMSDAQLLDRFVSDRDATAEHAFEVLVRRHGPMVLSVCRSVLGDQHEAEDAFQATFLVLARRAASLRDPANLGPWLYGVARRTSQKAKARRSRLERLIQRAGSWPGPGPSPVSDGNPGHGRKRPRCCTRRSVDCRKSTGRPSSSATSKGSAVKRPRSNSAGPWARWESG